MGLLGAQQYRVGGAADGGFKKDVRLLPVLLQSKWSPFSISYQDTPGLSICSDSAERNFRNSYIKLKIKTPGKSLLEAILSIPLPKHSSPSHPAYMGEEVPFVIMEIPSTSANVCIQDVTSAK